MSIPTTVRRPGNFFEMTVDRRGAIQALLVRVLVAAIKSAAGTAVVGSAVRVLDDDAADTLAGRGSQGAILLRSYFEWGRRAGVAVAELWFIAIAAPSSGAAVATQTLTVTVTTAQAGDVVFKIAGRTLVASVAAGDSPTAIAASMKAAMDANTRILPVTATVAAGVLTSTAVHAGVHGNDIAYQIVSTPSGVSIASAAGTVGAGTIDVTATLDATLDRDYDGIVLGNHGATDISDAVAHNNAAWGFEQQRYRHIFLGERGTLATANGLAVAANNKTVVVVPCEGIPHLPGEMAAQYAAAVFSKINDSGTMPNANLDGERLYLSPPSSVDAFTAPEQESALAAGCSPLIPTDDGQAVQIVRAVTTRTLTDGAPDESEYDLAYSRTQAFVARKTDLRLKANHKQETRDDDLLTRMRDTVLGVHREIAGYKPPVLVRSAVERLKGEIKAEYAPSPDGRVLIDAPFLTAGNHHQTVVNVRQLVRLPT